jgi:predicted nucleic acid-binding protein
MAVSHWLVDKSALVRLSQSRDADEWASRIERGLVHISGLTRLEVGFSARSVDDLRAAKTAAPLAWLVTEYLTPAIEDRAIEVQEILANRGLHRAPSIPDLLIAATAELASLTLLHVDKDFDLIAAITGQPAEWLAF